MSMIYPSSVTWRDCSEPPRSFDYIEPGGEMLVFYHHVDPITGEVTFGIMDARWNGSEFRSDDYGETTKPNLFDPAYGYVPLKWAIITPPGEFVSMLAEEFKKKIAEIK